MGRNVKMMQIETERSTPTVARPVLAVLAGVLLVTIGFVAIVGPGQNDGGSAAEAELYTLAGFRVTTSYKCIFPTCTDFWCDANCNHEPVYCPASFCKKVVTRVRVAPPPAPPPPPVTAAPTPLPTAAPTCKAVAQTTPDMSECHPTCILGKAAAKANGGTAGSVASDQCTNCFCAGCSSDLFTANCGGVAPTVAACTPPVSSCCPSTCMGGEFNIRPQMCTNCECAGCLPALFGNNCNSEVPAKCS